MVYLQVKLEQLADSLRALKNVSTILFTLVTAEERGQTLYTSLKKVDSMVKELNDELLISMYNRIFRVFLSGVPHQQIAPDDYFTFIKRLGNLLDEASAQANEAYASLREAIGPETVVSRWKERDNQS